MHINIYILQFHIYTIVQTLLIGVFNNFTQHDIVKPETILIGGDITLLYNNALLVFVFTSLFGLLKLIDAVPYFCVVES